MMCLGLLVWVGGLVVLFGCCCGGCLVAVLWIGVAWVDCCAASNGLLFGWVCLC